jgi:hypothetical protein
MLCGMDPISQFQQQLAPMVYGVLGSYWPFVLVVVIAVGIWFFAPPRWRNSDGVLIDMSTDGDGDSGGDGGGDGGGGGD